MKTKSPKVSVLMPIYNAMPFLEQAMDSVVNQTLKDIEIICINDGSTDDSLSVIKKYAHKDKRIVIIDKKNTGYGDSMNKGLARATGDYIGILEPDDWAELDMFQSLYELAKKFNADAVKSNFYFHSEGLEDTINEIVAGDEIDKLINPVKNPHIFFNEAAIWSGLYKSTFLSSNEISFTPSPGASYQDTGFDFKVWATAKRAAFLDRPFIHYRIDNNDSSVKSNGKVLNVCEEFASIEKYLRDKKLIKKLAPILHIRKFEIYLWNAGRLAGKNKKAFLKKMSEEFAKHEQAGELNTELFSDKQKKVLRRIIHSWRWYYYREQIGKLLWHIKSALMFPFTKLSPTYRVNRYVSEKIDGALKRDLETTILIDNLIRQYNIKCECEVQQTEHPLNKIKKGLAAINPFYRQSLRSKRKSQQLEHDSIVLNEKMKALYKYLGGE